MTRQDIFKYVRDVYQAEPEYLWARTPNAAVFRHKGSRKWFGIVMDIPEDKLGLQGNKIIDILNIKCDPLLKDALQQQKGFFPAYHMNKTYWITIRLDSFDAWEEVFHLVDISYDLTAEKKRKNSYA